MSIKTFMTYEEDRQGIINESKKETVHLYWNYYNYRGSFSREENGDNIENEEVLDILNNSEKYDITITAYNTAESYIDVPVRVIKNTQYGQFVWRSEYALSGIGYDGNSYLCWYSGGYTNLFYFSWEYYKGTFYFNYKPLSDYYPCLIEGTPINMFDGTEKPIEQVRAGDIVLSYNPITESQVPAVVLEAYPTGAERQYTVYNFSNGKHLTIYGLHGYYDKVSGTTQDIRDINRDKRLIDIDSNVIQWAGSRERYFAGKKKVRYNILTSNNLYFANGILLGSRPHNKLQYYLDRNIKLPENIESVWQQDCDDYNDYNEFLTDANFYKEVADDYQELAKSKNIIRVNKKRLELSDYKNAKQVEGLLNEEEWNSAKDKRSIYRHQINDNEILMKQHQKNVDDVIARYRQGKTSKSIFEACCERDNAIFEKVKNYFNK